MIKRCSGGELIGKHQKALAKVLITSCLSLRKTLEKGSKTLFDILIFVFLAGSKNAVRY